MNCSNVTFQTEIMPYLYANARIAVFGYGMCCLVIVGVGLNVLNLLVFLRPLNQKLSLNIFLSALSVTDSLNLVSVLFNHALPVIAGELSNQRKAVVILRVIFYPVLRSCHTASLWLFVCASFERFLVVWFPLNSCLQQTRRAMLLICVVALCSVLVNVPAFSEFSITKASSQRSTGALYRVVYNSSLNVPYHLIMRSIFQMAIPFVLIGCLNGAICWAMRSARLAQLALGSTQIAAQHKEIMVVAYACFDVACNTLPTIQYVLHHVLGEARYCKAVILYLVLRDLSVLLLTMRAASSFLVYYAWGTKFRHDCRHILCGVPPEASGQRPTMELTPLASRSMCKDTHVNGNGNHSNQASARSGTEQAPEYRRLLDVPASTSLGGDNRLRADATYVDCDIQLSTSAVSTNHGTRATGYSAVSGI